jgi:hypothetical protein
VQKVAAMKRLRLLAIFLYGCAGAELTQETGPDLGDTVDMDVAKVDLAKALPDMTPLPPPPDLAPAVVTKKVLPFTWQGEEVYYFCGPSAARMALSSGTNNLPSQDTLGNYMGTTTDGTDDISLVRNALNHYLGINSYTVTYLPNDPPSQAEQDALKKALVESIDAGRALVANVVSGWRPPGYPGGTIYHYITLVGYDESGDKVMIADPAATGCGSGHCGDPNAGFGMLPESYWINTHDLGVWITPKGYTFAP